MEFSGLRVTPQSIVVRGIAQGTVAADKTVVVSFAGTDVTCLAARDLTTAAGDIVIGLRQPGQIIIVARIFATAPDPPDEGEGAPSPEATGVSGELVIYPVETRSYRSSGWRNDMDDLLQSEWGGDLYTGCAFYGTTPRSLAGATVINATVKVKRVPGGSSDSRVVTMWRLTQSIKPSGAPTRSGSSFTGPDLKENETDTFTIPVAVAQDIVDGTAGGLAIYVPSDSDPHVRLAGRDKWAASMVLTIQWSRTT